MTVIEQQLAITAQGAFYVTCVIAPLAAAALHAGVGWLNEDARTAPFEPSGKHLSQESTSTSCATQLSFGKQLYMALGCTADNVETLGWALGYVWGVDGGCQRWGDGWKRRTRGDPTVDAYN